MQKINLYLYLPKPKITILKFKFLVLMYGIFFSLLMLNYCSSLICKHHLNSKLIIAKEQLNLAQQNLTEFSAKYGKTDTTIKLVDSKTLNCQVKFSVYLEGLSHAIPAGVWLTNFSLTGNGSQMVLKGNAIKASLVEEFLARLNKEPGFFGKVFEIQELNKMDDARASSETESSLGFILITKA